MFGWDDPDDGAVVVSRANVLVRKIRELKNSHTLMTLTQGAELKIYQNELDELRKKCNHRWEVVMMFNRHRRWCKVCDLEDYNYRHQT